MKRKITEGTKKTCPLKPINPKESKRESGTSKKKKTTLLAGTSLNHAKPEGNGGGRKWMGTPLAPRGNGREELNRSSHVEEESRKKKDWKGKWRSGWRALARMGDVAR